MDSTILQLSSQKKREMDKLFSGCSSSDLVAFPQNEIEGIKDCYAYTDEPFEIYSEIGQFLHSNSVNVSCQSIDFDASIISEGVTFCTTITLDVTYNVEFNVVLYLSRTHNPSTNDDVDDEGSSDHKMYAVRINRIEGDYMAFWKIRSELVHDVLSLFESQPPNLKLSLSDESSDSDSTPFLSISEILKLEDNDKDLEGAPTDDMIDVEYDYSIYEDLEFNSGDDDADFVWIE